MCCGRRHASSRAHARGENQGSRPPGPLVRPWYRERPGRISGTTRTGWSPGIGCRSLRLDRFKRRSPENLGLRPRALAARFGSGAGGDGRLEPEPVLDELLLGYVAHYGAEDRTALNTRSPVLSVAPSCSEGGLRADPIHSGPIRARTRTRRASAHGPWRAGRSYRFTRRTASFGVPCLKSRRPPGSSLPWTTGAGFGTIRPTPGARPSSPSGTRVRRTARKHEVLGASRTLVRHRSPSLRVRPPRHSRP